MNIKEIVTAIPNEVAKFYKHIYIVSEKNNEFYDVDYQGNKTIVNDKKEYKVVEEKLKDYNKPTSVILDAPKGIYTSKVHGDDLILMNKMGDYKVIYIINLLPKKDNEKHKIIVADDSTVITKFLTKIFSDEYEVLVAHNGDETIKLLEENDLDEIDGCLTDLNMPVSSGFKVLDYFKDHDLFKKVPISIISGENDAETISKVTIEYDVVDMLQKPFDKAAARNLVTKTINFYK